MRKEVIILGVLIGISLSLKGQEQQKSNNIYLHVYHHLEKRGTEKYYTGNPEITIGYERNIFSFGNNTILIGCRTGFYREYVLTGYGWSHPTKTRFFIGATPSYRLDMWDKFKLQVNGIWDMLLPDDYKERWSYFGIEPSFSYYISNNIYIAVSGTMGVFLFFDPKAYMDKAGIKIGVSF
ncbi:MAG: hypothetical protein KAU83_10735 [Bacteroidales bacterium]|nr:hypothetical protein [Bacteroidales bacterium]